MAFKETSPKIRLCQIKKITIVIIIRCSYFKCLDNQSLISLVELNEKADTNYSQICLASQLNFGGISGDWILKFHLWSLAVVS